MSFVCWIVVYFQHRGFHPFWLFSLHMYTDTLTLNGRFYVFHLVVPFFFFFNSYMMYFTIFLRTNPAVFL